MESTEENSYSYYHLYEKIALVSLLKREMNKTSGNLGCITPDTQTKKKKAQQNVNNNNNISPKTSITIADEQNQLLHFYVFNVSRERNLHLSTNSNDKRLLIFHNISNSLYKIGLRNGDVLIYLNNLNLLQPPIALTIDRVKSELTALRKQNQLIQIGICRCSNQSLLNNITIKHLGALTFDQFENLSLETHQTRSTDQLTESKKFLNLFSNKKKFISNSKRSSARDSGFVETDVDHSLVSTSHKHRSKISTDRSEIDGSVITQKSSEKDFNKNRCSIKVIDKHCQTSTQIVTDACCIYRREVIQPYNSYAMILRGREIAYEAAHSPTIPSSMPNYTHDQIRELYGELDEKTRRLQENECLFHTPMIDAWEAKSPWIEECPLPKFRLEKDDSAILLSTYLSTGLTNNPCMKIYSNEKENVRGSFRTAIADRTSVTPSPLIFNVQMDFNKTASSSETPLCIPEIVPSLAKISELMDVDSLIDLDEETIIPLEKANIDSCEHSSQNEFISSILNIKEMNVSPSVNNEENLPIDNLIRIVRAIHDYNFIYEELNDKDTVEIVQECQKNEQINSKNSNFLYIKEEYNDNNDEFGDLYERYITKLDHYDIMLKQLDRFEQKPDVLTPISEEPVTLIGHNHDNQLMKDHIIDEHCVTITCQRQNDHIGHYGFELDETIDGKIQISSIFNYNYYSHMKIGDELIAINHYSTLQTLEQCHLLLHSFWHRHYDYVQITIRTSKQPISQPVSLQSSSLSWPLSIAESEPQHNI